MRRYGTFLAGVVVLVMGFLLVRLPEAPRRAGLRAMARAVRANISGRVQPTEAAPSVRETDADGPIAASGPVGLARARPRPGRLPDLRDPEIRTRTAARRVNLAREAQAAARERAEREGWAARWTNGRAICELVGFRHGRPFVYTTLNSKAALSSAADQVRATSPYNVDGFGLAIGLWDAGAARSTHREFDDRVILAESIDENWHSTHVAGTLAASGVTNRAMGMAPAATIRSYHWAGDVAEMTAEGTAVAGETGTVRVSNHSYGALSGWAWISDDSEWRWYGAWGQTESDLFGIYDGVVADWDALCVELPYFLPFKSAGNDRNDGPPPSGTTYKYYDLGWQSKVYTGTNDPPHDGWDNGGYDTVTVIGNAKNVVTVGSVSDAYSAGVRSVAAAAMTTYSGWGPTDDGRIKPDIVGNGESLYSADADSDSDYTTASGTSMASPNVAGSALLLVDLYEQSFPGDSMRSSTLKGLILHTADDMGNPGPDYRFGWGLMNTKRAADLVLDHALIPAAGFLREAELTLTNTVQVHDLQCDGAAPVRVTLCWTDPAAEPLSAVDDPTLTLVNDLDLRVVDPAGVTNAPWVLDPANPSSNAVTGDNFRDNVEQVYIAEPGLTGLYSIVVFADGTLQTSGQVYSVVVSGATYPPAITHTPPENTSETTTAYTVEAEIVSLAGHAAGSPRLFWNTDGSVVFQTNAMANVTGSTWRAEIPAQPLETTVYYYFAATATNGLTGVAPAGAPGALYSFGVTPALDLVIEGTPDRFGTVTPDYGTHAVPSGNVVNAQSSPTALADSVSRYVNTGWAGAGSVPASGTSHQVSFALDESSMLTWQWQLQYALVHTSTVSGLFATSTWWEVGALAAGITAPDSLSGDGTNYAFAGWALDGVRQPDPTNAAANPVTGISMSTSHLLTATYLPAALDLDDDGLPDWWERLYYGSGDPDPLADSDDDGYLNVEEYQDGSDPRDPGSVPGPPEIIHDPLTDPQLGPAPWTVTATITDNYAIARATLAWQRNGLAWREAEMTETDAPSVFEGIIPEPGILGDTFVYRIEASDELGYRVQGATNGFFVAYPIIDVTPTHIEVLLLAGTSTNLGLAFDNSGNTNLVWSLETPPIGASDSIAGSGAGWSSGGENDLWHVSSNRYYSAPYAWYAGRDSSHEYGSYMLAHLDTPPVLLAGDARLTFMHWMRSEVYSSTVTWDGGRVELSTDGGATFSAIAPEGGYPYQIRGHTDSPWPGYTGVYGGTGGWQQAEFDLTAYAGEEVIVRFVFGSDGLEVEEGWYIDDVNVTPYSVTNAWLNMTPTNGVLVPGTDTNISITLDSTPLPSGTDAVLVIRLDSNDPVWAPVSIETLLRVRSIPLPVFRTAAQTSTNGSGQVTITADVYDPDGEFLAVELTAAPDGVTTGFTPWVASAAATFGSPAVSNAAAHPVTEVASSEGDSASTNTLTIVWATTNGVNPVLFSTNTTIRLRFWDGLYWSPSVTSQPFLVDNVAPSVVSNVSVSSHSAGLWSTNPLLTASWDAASDGDGIGLGGYALVLTNAAAPVPAPWIRVTGVTGTVATASDGSNLWFGVRAVDVYGNAGATRHAGPFRVDTTPPSATGAVVTVETSTYGGYVVGNPLAVSWGGFSDALSGISNYSLSFTGTGGLQVASSPAALSGAALEASNSVYVRAIDHAGLAGAAAMTTVLVLDPAEDYDGDGITSEGEQFTGTDASNIESAFALAAEAVRLETNTWAMVLDWESLTGRLYAVYRRPFLVDTNWDDTPITNLHGTGGTMSYTDRVEQVGQRFYRVKVTAP